MDLEGCFSKHDGLSDRATDHCPMLFVHSKKVWRPVGQSVAVSNTAPWTPTYKYMTLVYLPTLMSRESLMALVLFSKDTVYIAWFHLITLQPYHSLHTFRGDESSGGIRERSQHSEPEHMNYCHQALVFSRISCLSPTCFSEMALGCKYSYLVDGQSTTTHLRQHFSQNLLS